MSNVYRIRALPPTDMEARTPSGGGGGGSGGGGYSGGTGGSGGGMDDVLRRVGRLEDDFKEIKGDLKAIRSEIADVKGRVMGVDGRIQGIEGRFAHLPTTLQLGGFILAIFVAAGIMRLVDRPAAPPAAVSAAPTR